MFKAGDRVKCIDNNNPGLELNKIYTVEKIITDGITDDLVKLVGVSAEAFVRRFVLAESENTIKPMNIKVPAKGLRYNENKLRWRNFPMYLMKPLIEVAQYGESKYDTFNFLKGQTTLDSMDSLKRHLELFESPYESDNDAESKVNHLAHVAWNALVALHMIKTRPDLDDRYKLPEQKLEE